MNWKSVEAKFGEGIASRCYNAWHSVFGGGPDHHSVTVGLFLEQYVLVLAQMIHDPGEDKVNTNNLMMELLRRSYPPLSIVSGKPTKSRLIQLTTALRKNGISTDPELAGHFSKK
ncbi:hypothetical protein HON36_02780 [Candidatus Parcubacteria bacterium]|jgi:hypothetical protein|nr:hypothetical protein [Candidatus Parcubacteria bacterium]MBT7228547.1 hypothetical protein [Candidatus Parcubacteria bacterium]